MKKKITMICILKSGQKVTDTIKFNTKDSRVLKAIEEMRKNVETFMSSTTATVGNITFGKTTIQLSEVAAISFKD